MNGNALRFESYLESLHSHRKVVLLPDSFIHLSILSSTKLVLHRDVSSLYLPLVVVWRHAVNSGLIAFGRRVVQSGDEPICNGWMMMDQLCQGVETALWRDIQLGTKETERTQSHIRAFVSRNYIIKLWNQSVASHLLDLQYYELHQLRYQFWELPTINTYMEMHGFRRKYMHFASNNAKGMTANSIKSACCCLKCLFSKGWSVEKGGYFLESRGLSNSVSWFHYSYLGYDIFTCLNSLWSVTSKLVPSLPVFALCLAARWAAALCSSRDGHRSITQK